MVKRKKTKEKKKHRVYCTYFPDGRYYIGYSCKTDKQFEKYFGSSAIVKESTEHLKKEIIAEYDTRAPAKMQEFLLQWQQRHDDCCINDMLHVRIRSSFLKDFGADIFFDDQIENCKSACLEVPTGQVINFNSRIKIQKM